MNDARHAIADAVLAYLDLRLDYLARDARDAAQEVIEQLDERRKVRTIIRTVDEDDCTMDEQVFDDE